MAFNELLVDVLRRDLVLLNMTLGDCTDADLAQRPVPAANNALWQLGHLIVSEINIVNDCAGKTIISIPAGYAEKYSRETASVNDPARLGTKAELLAEFEKTRSQACAWVSSLSPDEMSKPAPEKLRNFFPTVGHMIQLFPAHLGMHIGQFQVLRRKLGKPILM